MEAGAGAGKATSHGEYPVGRELLCVSCYFLLYR
jgi:hypothetical protein